jgi:hypothetical protein
MNEVRKDEVTAAEIEVLRMVHGDDAVVEIKPAGDVKRSDNEERQRIYDRYAGPADNMPEAVAKKLAKIRGILGHDRAPLPQSIEFDAGDEEEAAPPAKKKKAGEPAFAE